jgi:hypothetical protein
MTCANYVPKLNLSRVLHQKFPISPGIWAVSIICSLWNIACPFRDARGRVVVLCSHTAISATLPKTVSAHVMQVSCTCFQIFAVARLKLRPRANEHKPYIFSQHFLTQISRLPSYHCSCPPILMRALSTNFHTSGRLRHPLFRGIFSKCAASCSLGAGICIGCMTSWKKDKGTAGKSCIVNI